jgi:drug/metabolite transporter (DMT)-like permease
MNAPSSPRSTRLGYAWLLCGVSLFSTIEVVARELSPMRPPLQIAFWRFFIAGLLLWPVAWLRRRAERPTWNRTDWILSVGLGLIGVTAAIGLYHAAVARMSAARAAILFSAHPVFVAALAPALLSEHVRREHWWALGLALVGIGCFLADHSGLRRDSLGGIVLMLGAMTFFAMYTTVSKRAIQRQGVWTTAAATFLIGSLFLLPITWIADGPPWHIPNLRHWWAILYLAVLATAIGYGAYFHGLSLVPAHAASMTFFLKPPLATLLAVLLLREPLTVGTILGGGFIVAATLYTVRRSPTASV